MKNTKVEKLALTLYLGRGQEHNILVTITPPIGDVVTSENIKPYISVNLGDGGDEFEHLADTNCKDSKKIIELLQEIAKIVS